MDGPTPIMAPSASGEEVSPFESRAAKEVSLELEATKQLKLLGQEGKLTFNWSSHHKSRVNRPKFPAVYNSDFRKDFGLEESVLNGITFTAAQAEAVLAAIREPGRGLPVVLFKCTGLLACQECGKDLELQFNGRDIYATTRCRYPSGFPEIKAVISVPSGRLVFANFFKGVPATKGPGGEGVGAMAYKHETRHYAKYNVAHAFCGNTSPRIFVSSKRDKVVIGRPALDHKTFQDVPDPWPDYKQAGAITTEAWSWAAACEDTVRMFEEQVPVALKLKVLPGQYRIIQQYHLANHNDITHPLVYGVLERIGR